MTIDAAGVIHGGLVMLDRDGELQSASPRPLRVHELGHTMGLSHVTTRDSFMKWLIEPNDFDKEAFRVAARRPPGNRSPDVDPANFTLNAPVQLQHDLARGPAVVQPIERVRSRGSQRIAFEPPRRRTSDGGHDSRLVAIPALAVTTLSGSASARYHWLGQPRWTPVTHR